MKKLKIGLLICCVAVVLAVFVGCSCEHEYGEWSVTTPATCTAEGVEERACTKCSEKETRPVEKADHSFGEVQVVTEANCTEAGSQQKTCSVCNEVVSEEIAPAGHTWSEATCKAPKTCTVCKVTEGDAADHAWIEATCEKAKTCETCGLTEGKALGHKWTKATCTQASKCSVCGEKGTTASHVSNSEAKCKNCGKAMTAADFTYLAGGDFRAIKGKYSSAKAEGAYVILYTDVMGDKCVLSYVVYKIGNYYYYNTTMDNLTKGKSIADPADYYDILSDRYYGQERIDYMNLSLEVMKKESIALQNIKSMLTNGTHSGEGAYVSASMLNL